jgi:sulfite reductase (NADPH) flavoprotein alpha-component
MKSASISEYSSPLSRDQAEQLRRLVEGLMPDQLLWISGYLAGICATSAPTSSEWPQGSVQSLSRLEARPALTVLFGSQTGNAEKIAERLKAKAEAQGFSVTVQNMLDYPKNQLKKDKNLFLIVSTHGEGEPPDNAKEFYDFLHGRRAPSLEGTRFSVLALGDSSYSHFCQTGKDFDVRLEALGARRIHERVDCDVDYDEAAAAWCETVLSHFAPEPNQSASATVAVSATLPAAAVVKSIYSRKNPFPAILLTNLKLNGRGSPKETRHIELSLEGSGLQYEPGDSLGIAPSNDPSLVEELLCVLDLAAEAEVTVGGSHLSLGQALTTTYEITTLTRPFIEGYARLTESQELKALLREDQQPALTAFMESHQLIDVVTAYPVPGLAAAEFIGLLRKLPPRLYSIASSFKANPDEVHLTVAVVRYTTLDRQRKGVASNYLAERVEEGATVPVYVESNNNFRPPADPDTPIIMIGPGTGVAPFRAFMQEREELGAKGRNWLFFGAPHFTTDFLYQSEWLRYRKTGLLPYIDVAFSRDASKKVYVQHRMRERSKELYAWLQEGAHLYVCGDSKHMAMDVHVALLEIIQQEGSLTAEQAADYVKTLQKERRYQRDVY